jgi:hypothetical protein
MNFTLSKWSVFCRDLQNNGCLSITASDLCHRPELRKSQYLILKHDVETNVRRAYRIAKIEHKYGHRCSFYIQAYLLKNKKNIELLRKMQNFGHEISYHHDVMDYAKGDINIALSEFMKNLELFIDKGFNIWTVCQHGNPLIERVGYHSNRDFFRSKVIQETFPEIVDIMVNFKEEKNLDYLYFSDAGRVIHLVVDPINNDLCYSDEKNLIIKNLDLLLNYLLSNNCIISIHPHRWEINGIAFYFKKTSFIIIRWMARKMYKYQLFKNILNKYYYLAKKI